MYEVVDTPLRGRLYLPDAAIDRLHSVTSTEDYYGQMKLMGIQDGYSPRLIR